MNPVQSTLKAFALFGDAAGFMKRFREAREERVLILDVVIPGEPWGKERPRATNKGHVYTPKKTREWEKTHALIFKSKTNERKLEGKFALWVDAIGKRPQRLKKRNSPTDRVWRTARPDGDNVLKIVADTLQLSEILVNDCHIVEWFCRSYYTAIGEEPSIHVRLFKIRHSTVAAIKKLWKA